MGDEEETLQLCISEEQPFCSCSEGVRNAQALPVLLRAVGSCMGQDFGFKFSPCHVTSHFGQQFQLRLQKPDFQRALSCEHEGYLSSPNCLKPELLIQKTHLKYRVYCKTRPGNSLCLWQPHSLWLFHLGRLLCLPHLHSRVEEGIGQIFPMEKVWDELRSHNRKKVTLRFNDFKLFSTPYSEQPSRMGN